MVHYDESNLQGLTAQEVSERLARDGHNELLSAKKRTFSHILWDIVRGPWLFTGLIQGIGVLLVVLAVYAFNLSKGLANRKPA